LHRQHPAFLEKPDLSSYAEVSVSETTDFSFILPLLVKNLIFVAA